MKKFSMVAFAFMLFATSWQTFYTATKQLVVHTTPNPNSAICWQGPAFKLDPVTGYMVDNYDGHCTDNSLLNK